MNEDEKDAVQEARAQGKLNHLARLAQEHAERLAVYAHYNQRVDAQEEAYSLQRISRELLRELEAPQEAAKNAEIARLARDLKARLHGAFPGDAKTPLYTDLKRFLRLIELKGGAL